MRGNPRNPIQEIILQIFLVKLWCNFGVLEKICNIIHQNYFNLEKLSKVDETGYYKWKAVSKLITPARWSWVARCVCMSWHDQTPLTSRSHLKTSELILELRLRVMIMNQHQDLIFFTHNAVDEDEDKVEKDD